MDQKIRFRPDFDAWWPNYDHAPETCFKFVQRGLPDADIAARLCQRRRVCIQAGAHAGFWPRRLAGHFTTVYAFEPEPTLFECARANLRRWRVKNVDLRPDALGDQAGTAVLRAHRSAGSWAIAPGLSWDSGLTDETADVEVKVTTIDALGLPVVDAIYLDVEGFETTALTGAARTIARSRPIIHLEELPDSAAAIEIHMAALHYVRAAVAHKDVIFKPRERS